MLAVVTITIYVRASKDHSPLKRGVQNRKVNGSTQEGFTEPLI